jgi:hypothetical protein
MSSYYQLPIPPFKKKIFHRNIILKLIKHDHGKHLATIFMDDVNLVSRLDIKVKNLLKVDLNFKFTHKVLQIDALEHNLLSFTPTITRPTLYST